MNTQKFNYNSNPKVTLEKMTALLSQYPELIINEDKSVRLKIVRTTYFLENDDWTKEFFMNINQFQETLESWHPYNMLMKFRFDSPKINMELKSIVHYKIFKETNSIKTVFNWVYSLKHLSTFINKYYPKATSLFQLNMDETQSKWIDFLSTQNFKTSKEVFMLNRNKTYTYNTRKAFLIKHCLKYQEILYDDRQEWDKDKWDVRNLNIYGITYPESHNSHFANFTPIKDFTIRSEFKLYVQKRLLNKSLAWGTAQSYCNTFSRFIHFISIEKEDWNNLCQLHRDDIEKYICFLNSYASTNLRNKNSNPISFVHNNIIYLRKILADLQSEQYKSNIAPIKDIRMLFFPTDAPKIPKPTYNSIKHVPDFVLEQLFNKFHKLPEYIQPIIRIMFETGLRISDTLQLKQDCLITLNNKYYIKSNIKKTFIKDHRIPITEDLAMILKCLIESSIINSNEHNNPQKYIFVRYTGVRRGKPYSQLYIADLLNLFVKKELIVNEDNKLFHFHNHAFRHTYAVKLINNGVDILTVQDLLAHVSPEMTLNYAKLLDDTKRNEFENAVKRGVFSFDIDGKLLEKTDGEISEDILNMLWTNHKLNAVDTPYGTCLQRSKGKCSFSKRPHCLTCNGGNPCKDLCVGAFEGDVKKYEILIKSTMQLIEQARLFERKTMIIDNEELLEIYRNIYSTISSGSIIYSRLDQLKIQADIEKQQNDLN